MKYFILSIAFATAAIFGQPALEAAANADFITVAKESIPAVVSIQIKGKQKPVQQIQQNAPFDMFGDEFFQRFFGGIPRNYQQPQQQEPAQSQASGFIISEDGYVVTNDHVVKDAEEITVRLNDEREFKAKLIGKDPNTDLAVVKIDAQGLPHLNFGDSDQLEIGQWVTAIGTPFGLDASLTVGVVSAKGRNNLALADVEDFIQTDAAINRGNSGGPLLDLSGKVIGVNTAIVSSSGGHMGIGFAIPSNMAQSIITQLMENGKINRGFLGVSLQKINQDLATSFGLDTTQGALVAEVTKDSPASKSDLHQGDIIIGYNDNEVNNIGAFRNAVALMEPGTKLTLKILREGKEFTIPMEVGAYPAGKLAASAEASKIGLEVENLTTELAKTLGYTDEQGVVITDVAPNSPAAFAGIQKGALIIAVNKEKVASVEEFQSIISKAEEGQPILLLVKQGGFHRFVSLRAS